MFIFVLYCLYVYIYIYVCLYCFFICFSHGLPSQGQLTHYAFFLLITFYLILFFLISTILCYTIWYTIA